MRYNQRVDSAHATGSIPTMGDIKKAGTCPVTENELADTAEQCLADIFQNTNALTLKSIFTSLIDILDNSKHLETCQFLLEILPILISNAQSQYHFVIVSFVLEKIDSESRVAPKTTFISALSYLVSSGRLAGLTIPELLEVCVKHLKITSSNVDLSAPQKEPMHLALIQAIGSLATHLAYPEQINEIISFLVNKVAKEASVSSPNSFLFLKSILDALGEVITKINYVPVGRSLSILPSKLSYSLLIPLITTLHSSNIEVRLSLYNLISQSLMVNRYDRKHDEIREQVINLLISSIVKQSEQSFSVLLQVPMQCQLILY
jgi:hypothetical protein